MAPSGSDVSELSSVTPDKDTQEIGETKGESREVLEEAERLDQATLTPKELIEGELVFKEAEGDASLNTAQ